MPPIVGPSLAAMFTNSAQCSNALTYPGAASIMSFQRALPPGSYPSAAFIGGNIYDLVDATSLSDGCDSTMSGPGVGQATTGRYLHLASGTPHIVSAWPFKSADVNTVATNGGYTGSGGAIPPGGDLAVLPEYGQGPALQVTITPPPGQWDRYTVTITANFGASQLTNASNNGKTTTFPLEVPVLPSNDLVVHPDASYGTIITSGGPSDPIVYTNRGPSGTTPPGSGVPPYLASWPGWKHSLYGTGAQPSYSNPIPAYLQQPVYWGWASNDKLTTPIITSTGSQSQTIGTNPYWNSSTVGSTPPQGFLSPTYGTGFFSGSIVQTFQADASNSYCGYCTVTSVSVQWYSDFGTGGGGGGITPADLRGISADSHRGVVALAWNDASGKLNFTSHRSISAHIGSGGSGWDATQTIETSGCAFAVGCVFLPTTRLYLDYQKSGSRLYRTSDLMGIAGSWSASSAALAIGGDGKGIGRGMAFRFLTDDPLGSFQTAMNLCKNQTGATPWAAGGQVYGTGLAPSSSRAPGGYLETMYGALCWNTTAAFWSSSTDGTNFTVGPAITTIMQEPIALAVMGHGGMVGLSWDGETGGTGKCYTIRSRDQGKTWTEDTTAVSVIPALPLPNLPPVMVALHEGAYAIWIDPTSGNPKFAFTPDMGVTWT